MFVRYVVSRIDGRSNSQQGLIHAAESLRAKGMLADSEDSAVREVFGWLNAHLPHPQRFSRSAKPHACTKALSWFKDTASDCIARMEELASVLIEHGYSVERLTIERPGYVVYEDQFQVVAEPFRSRGK
jgi:hypothetical protein